MESVHLQLPADLLARVDEAAGDVPRNRWIRRAIERALPGQNFSPTGRCGVDEITPVRSTGQVKRDAQPRPKGGKR